MNRTRYGCAVAAIVGTLAVPTSAMADSVCQKLAMGGNVTISEPMMTGGCTATLTKDTTVKGVGSGKVITGNHGLVIELKGHKLTIDALPIEFNGDFALAVHGTNAEQLTLTGVTVTDKSGIPCGPLAAKRVGTILWKVKTAKAAVTTNSQSLRYGMVVGAPMVGEHHTPPDQLASRGTATITKAVPFCPGVWEYGDRPILAFERKVTGPAGEVESVGPCDFQDNVLQNLHHVGLPQGQN